MFKKLLELQKQALAISKESTNPFFQSKYFDINKLLEVIKPILSSQNLVLIQPLTNVNGRPAIATILLDTESNERIENVCTLPDLTDSQKMGGAITYFRRYGIVSLLALESEDDDGNSASLVSVPKSSLKPVKQEISHAVSDDEAFAAFMGEPVKNVEVCQDCGAEKVMGKKGLYCKPCYVKWANANKK